jgi:homoserine kinase
MGRSFTVKVPATTANLGPGFDALGLALDLWNEAEFTSPSTPFHGVERGETLPPPPHEMGRGSGGEVDWTVEVAGEGAGVLPLDATNLVARAARRLFERAGQAPPAGLRIRCTNRIPLGSGLGSSAAAVVAGLVGANALLAEPLDQPQVLRLAAVIEGHPDNAAAALLGGLVVVADNGGELIARKIEIPPLTVVVVVPAFNLPTHAARAALPGALPLGDAVFNLGRAALVVEALRTGDLDLLGFAMQDRLHQPYRLKLIPGAEAALAEARGAGAAAAALSGAGPGVVAFGREPLEPVSQAMLAAFHAAGLPARAWSLAVSAHGAQSFFQ